MIQVGGCLDSRAQAIVVCQCIYLVSKVMKGEQIVSSERKKKGRWTNVKNVYLNLFIFPKNAIEPDLRFLISTDPSRWYRDEID